MAEVEKNPMFLDGEGKGLINAENEAHAVNQPGKVSMKFQILATGLVVVAALLGGVVGVVISNNGSKDIAVSWVGLWGDLFIRALKCVVLPLVFINVILAVIQMIEAGKAGKVGRYTVLLYTFTTFLASVEGLVAVVLFKDRFTSEEPKVLPTYIQLMCPDGASAITEVEGGDLICAPYAEKNNASFFQLDNPNNYFITTGDDFEVITFSDTLQEGIFKKLVPDNIVNEFATGGFIGVVMFAIVFGAAAQKLEKKPVLLIDFLEDVNDILVKIIQWIIFLTPIAVFSLIAGALGGQKDLAKTFKNIGVLIQASVLSFAVHLLVVYPLLFVLITKRNPFAYMRYIIPAQIFAFACASSAATLPVTLRCVKESGQVPDSIRDFVLPIGATVNMDGTALYFPPAIVFLAVTAGLGDQLDAAAYFLIVVVSTIGSAGAAPVPNAGLVLIITAFNTVFSEVGTPKNFAIIVGIDWLMDRFQTALNVTGDTMVARIVTHIVGATPVPGKPSSQMPVEEQVTQ